MWNRFTFFVCLTVVAGCDGRTSTEDETWPDAGELTADPQPTAAGPRSRTSEPSPNAQCTIGTEMPCERSSAGHYAVMTELAVSWAEKRGSLFESGRGTIAILSLNELGDLCTETRESRAVRRVCGLYFPTLHTAATGFAMGLAVPDEAWEQDAMPVYSGQLRATAEEPTLEPVTSTLGVELAEPDAAWPHHDETRSFRCAHGRGKACFVDHDDDGAPGVSLQVRRGVMPASEVQQQFGGGATVLHAGLRVKLGGALPLGSDCEGGVGTADASDVELRVLGCSMLDGSDCSKEGAAFVDEHAPVFEARGDGDRTTVVRLGDLEAPVTCSDVREVFGITARE